MLNSCSFVGRLVADPEKRATKSNHFVSAFTIAVTRNRPAANGEWLTDYIDCVAWGPLADKVCKFHKGSMLSVNGHLTVNPYVDKNGNKRSNVVITVDFVQEVRSRKGSSASAAVSDVSTSPSKQEESFESIDETEDMPF